jgi:hypothetical protein
VHHNAPARSDIRPSRPPSTLDTFPAKSARLGVFGVGTFWPRTQRQSVSCFFSSISHMPILSSLNSALVLTCSGASTAYVFSVAVEFLLVLPLSVGILDRGKLAAAIIAAAAPTPPATPFIANRSISTTAVSQKWRVPLQLTRGRGLGSF